MSGEGPTHHRFPFACIYLGNGELGDCSLSFLREAADCAALNASGASALALCFAAGELRMTAAAVAAMPIFRNLGAPPLLRPAGLPPA